MSFHAPFSSLILSILALAAASSASALDSAVTDPSNPLPAIQPKERLPQLKQTFDSKVAALHRPILIEYLEKLQALKAKHELTGASTELSLIELEIAETEAKLQRGQGFDFDFKNPKTQGANASHAPRFEAKVVLNADQAKGAASGASTVTVGANQWKVADLAPGTYQISLIYLTPSSASPIQLRWSMLGKSGSVSIPAGKTGGESTPFHSVVLGHIQVPEAGVEALELNVENASPFGVPLHVRHAVLSQQVQP